LRKGSWAKLFFIFGVLAYLGVLVFLPFVSVFAGACSEGWQGIRNAFTDPAALSAIRLTLLVCAVVVPLNTLFGVAAAWAIARFRFPGRGLLLAFIELPLWISPVVGGLCYALLYGRGGALGDWLGRMGVSVLFTPWAVILATLFVTLPYVARGVVPILEARGSSEEEAARTLGASGWQVFWRVTLYKIRWGVLYGAILCNARALGEFGAVSVVSGHIRGRTNTIPLHIEILYNEYRLAEAFALASLLSLLALLMLAIKALVEAREPRLPRAVVRAGSYTLGTKKS
jgi:sulfate transport system permease protein